MLLQPSYYNKFKCIADRCKDNCCVGWEIDIDQESYNYYTSLRGEFSNKLKSNIITENGEHSFKLLANQRCAFLNKNNLCEIICNLGEDKLCQICSDHPRYINEYPNLTERGLGLSCEEACRIILTQDQPVTMTNPEEENENITCDNLFFNYLFKVRQIIINILQNRHYAITKRIATVVKICCIVQRECFSEKTDEELLGTISHLVNKSNNILKSSYKNNPVTAKKVINNVLITFEKLEVLNRKWLCALKKTQEYISSNNNFNREYDLFNTTINTDLIFENMSVYLIHRYFLESYYDNQIIEKALLVCVSYVLIKAIMIEHFAEQKNCKLDYITELIHNYSKEVEYSDQNINKLYQEFNCNNIYKIECILQALI